MWIGGPLFRRIVSWWSGVGVARTAALAAALLCAACDIAAFAVGANGFGASPHFNMRANGGVSPHHGNFRGTGYRPSSGLQASGSSKQRGGHSGTFGPPVGGTPVSPLGLPIGSSGAFPPNPLSGPGPAEAGASRTHVGTPPADTSGLSNPFSWNAEGGHSAPLSQLQFADAAHKAVHDEVMKVWPYWCVLGRGALKWMVGCMCLHPL